MRQVAATHLVFVSLRYSAFTSYGETGRQEMWTSPFCPLYATLIPSLFFAARWRHTRHNTRRSSTSPQTLTGRPLLIFVCFYVRLSEVRRVRSLFFSFFWEVYMFFGLCFFLYTAIKRQVSTHLFLWFSFFLPCLFFSPAVTLQNNFFPT